MVSTEQHFEKLAELYSELFRQTMILHNIREIRCTNKGEHYFDRLTIDGGGLKVYKYGNHTPFSFLNYDFTNDYARCLSYIEDDLYLALRNGKPMHGMYFTFN